MEQLSKYYFVNEILFQVYRFVDQILLNSTLLHVKRFVKTEMLALAS
jgi:hypothetical protein